MAQAPTGWSGNRLTATEQEEAAFLASVMLTDAATDKVTLTASGTGSGEYRVAAGTDVKDFEADLGPIQLAIWYVTGAWPSPLSSTWTSVGTISDLVVQTLVKAAQNAATNQWFDSSLQVFAYGRDSGSRNFISVAAPEPGTMVLFGAGALLMGLGGIRRRIARRR